jgi:hypothetical protein
VIDRLLNVFWAVLKAAGVVALAALGTIFASAVVVGLIYYFQTPDPRQLSFAAGVAAVLAIVAWQAWKEPT